jgi:hypothetical protein
MERPYIVGFHTSLDRLESLLNGRPEAWDWDRHNGLQQTYADLGLAPAPTDQ